VGKIDNHSFLVEPDHEKLIEIKVKVVDVAADSWIAQLLYLL